MSLMTESKIIHEADQEEEFQQNPQYYHRNINPHQIFTDINALSSQVNTFLSKLNNTKISNKLPTSSLRNSSFNNQTSFANPQSQIDQISFATTNLIESLHSIHKLQKNKNLNRSLENYSLIPQQQSQISLKKQISPQIIQKRSNTTKKNDTNYQALKESTDQNYLNKRQINIKPFNLSKDKFSKTVDVPRKKFNHEGKNFHILSKHSTSNVQQKKFDKIDDFDDKQTIVNESRFNGRRKYFKQSKQKYIQSQRTKKQTSNKLTKQKLLQKILNLQNTVYSLKWDQYHNQKAMERKNIVSGLYNNAIKSKSQVERKFSQSYDQQNQESKKKRREQSLVISQRISSSHRKDALSCSKKSNNFVDENLPRKLSTQTKNKDRKVSLKKWVEDVW